MQNFTLKTIGLHVVPPSGDHSPEQGLCVCLGACVCAHRVKWK